MPYKTLDRHKCRYRSYTRYANVNFVYDEIQASQKAIFLTITIAYLFANDHSNKMVSKNRHRLWLDFGKERRNSAVNLIQINCAIRKLIWCLSIARPKGKKRTAEKHGPFLDWTQPCSIYLFICFLMQIFEIFRDQFSLKSFVYFAYSSSFSSIQFIHLFDESPYFSRGMLIWRGKFPLYQINVCSAHDEACLFAYTIDTHFNLVQSVKRKRIGAEKRVPVNHFCLKWMALRMCVCMYSYLYTYIFDSSVIFGTSTMSKFAHTQIKREGERVRGW